MFTWLGKWYHVFPSGVLLHTCFARSKTAHFWVQNRSHFGHPIWRQEGQIWGPRPPHSGPPEGSKLGRPFASLARILAVIRLQNMLVGSEFGIRLGGDTRKGDSVPIETLYFLTPWRGQSQGLAILEIFCFNRYQRRCT